MPLDHWPPRRIMLPTTEYGMAFWSSQQTDSQGGKSELHRARVLGNSQEGRPYG